MVSPLKRLYFQNDYKWPPLKYSRKYFYVETTKTFIYIYIYIQNISEKMIAENIILVSIFWGHS